MRSFGIHLHSVCVSTSRPGAPAALLSAMVIALVAANAGTAVGQTCEINELSKHLASDGFRLDEFGSSVAVYGDIAVIGAEGHEHFGGENPGAAYVFRRNAESGAWVEEIELFAGDGLSGDEFGTAVAAGDNLAVIAANQHLTGRPGAVYVFRYFPEGAFWIQEQKITASDGMSNDEFGISVSLSGDVMAVGAWHHRANGFVGTGAAYIYRYEPVTAQWLEEAKLVSSDVAQGDALGFSVSVSGDVALVGARSDDDQGNLAGSAYVFRYDPVTRLWNEEAKLIASDGREFNEFGTTVAISGDVAMVSAQQFNLQPVPGPGAVYVFRRDAATGMWNEETILIGSGSIGQGRALFGFSLAFPTSDSGTPTDVVIGARAENSVDSLNFSGTVYWYRYNGSNWVEEAKFIASDAADGDWLGHSAATDGGTVVAGALNDNEFGSISGAAYVFELSNSGCTSGGDLNCDGVVDTGDVPAFALALVDAVGYALAYPGCDILQGDLDGDGTVGGLDIAGFVSALIAP